MILNIFKIIIVSIFGSMYQAIGIGVDSYKYLVNTFVKIDKTIPICDYTNWNCFINFIIIS